MYEESNKRAAKIREQICAPTEQQYEYYTALGRSAPATINKVIHNSFSYVGAKDYWYTYYRIISSSITLREAKVEVKLKIIQSRQQ